jgi:hypothetical protein
MSLLYVIFIGITLANAESSGLLAKGGRLEFYFANDWYRRMVTFSTVPSMVATYHALFGLLSPAHRRFRLRYILNICLLFISSLLGGSKGAALLYLGIASAFVFPMKRVRLVRIGVLAACAAVAYVALFLSFTSKKSVTLFSMVERFYLSIDMSILVQQRQAAAAIAGRLNDVWLEVFRSLSTFGVRVSDMPIGGLVYYYALGVPPQTGANCRFGSLLLLYPDRVDFLIGYPLLVCLMGWLLYQALCAFNLRWSGRVAVPLFIFIAFQDVYWFASHVAPIILITLLLSATRAIRHVPVRNSSDSVEDGDYAADCAKSP